jgi:hypothetical protein
LTPPVPPVPLEEAVMPPAPPGAWVAPELVLELAVIAPAPPPPPEEIDSLHASSVSGKSKGPKARGDGVCMGRPASMGRAPRGRRFRRHFCAGRGRLSSLRRLSGDVLRPPEVEDITFREDDVTCADAMRLSATFAAQAVHIQ